MAAFKNAKENFVVISTGFDSAFYKNGSPLVATKIETISNVYVMPQVIVTSADGNTFLGRISGAESGKIDNHIVIKEIGEKFLESGIAPKQPTSFKWYVSERGSARNAPLHGVNHKGIIIHPSNEEIVMPFAEMQVGGVKFAKRYHEKLEVEKYGPEMATLKKTFVYPETETWVSTSGKTVQAKFVGLKGDSLMLVLEETGGSNKNYRLLLSKLDKSSQLKAKVWKKTLRRQKADVLALKEKLK